MDSSSNNNLSMDNPRLFNSSSEDNRNTGNKRLEAFKLFKRDEGQNPSGGNRYGPMSGMLSFVEEMLCDVVKLLVYALSCHEGGVSVVDVSASS